MPYSRQNFAALLTKREVRTLNPEQINYLNLGLLQRCVNERGKLYSAKRIGLTAKMQRQLRTAVLQARYLSLLPYAPSHRKTNSLARRSEPQTAPTPAAVAADTPEAEGEQAPTAE